MALPYKDRVEAGEQLAAALAEYAGRQDLLVLALPRGGVPVAYPIAAALGAELDLMLVRKLGTPGQEELAMGAIAAGGARVLNRNVVLGYGIGEQVIERVAAREQQELERRLRAYRGERPLPSVEGRTVILVDDGLATGASMRAAVAALRQLAPAQIVVAVPVAPPDTVELLRGEADRIVCLATPEPFFAVGQWYAEFPQTSDAEVIELLQRAWSAKEDSSK